MNLENSVGRHMFERAVTLASDSLYFYSATRQPEPEFGQKVFPLARNCVAVIAGDVASARDALCETKRRMDQLEETCDWERFGAIVHDCFDDVIPRYSHNLDIPIEVDCLIGICPSTGEPNILKVSSASTIRFEPVFTGTYEAIGADEDTRQAFRALMEDRTRLGGGQNALAGEALRVLEALDSTIATHPEYIGRPVQAMMITRDGLRTLSAFDIASPDDITRITPPQDWAPGPP